MESDPNFPNFSLLWIGGKALLQTQAARRAPTVLKNVALLAAAPFVGLAFAVLLPLVRTFMLHWVGGKALMNRAEVA